MAVTLPEGGGPHILLGCTGSVATIKVPQIAQSLTEQGASAVIVATEKACHFLCAQAMEERKALKEPVLFNTNQLKLGKKEVEFDSIVETKDASVIENDKHDSSNANQCRSEAGGVNVEMGNNSNVMHLPKQFERCALCNHSLNFCHAAKKLYPQFHIFTDEDEWSWKKRGDQVLHIELRKWAQVLVLAPLDANTLAKAAQGLCDNLLTCVLRAWDMTKPVLFCPAMNTHMYNHPLTKVHINIMKELGYEEVPAISKKLVCGDQGQGAMAEPETIVARVMQSLQGREHLC